MVCWGTGYQQITRLGGEDHKTAEATWQAFARKWVSVFGAPEVIVVDPGLEFQGYFADACGHRGIAIFPTDARSPWQNGRTDGPGKNGRDNYRKQDGRMSLPPMKN